MVKFGKDIFGKGFNLKAEVTNGHCPLCESKTVFVSLYHHVYRCMSCGGDTKQKVNGVISYMRPHFYRGRTHLVKSGKRYQ